MTSTKTDVASTNGEIDAQPSSQREIYTPFALFFYDFLVLRIVSTFAWGCSVRSYLLPQFRSNIGAKHLDIGVGTGYYIRKAPIPSTTQLTLVDTERTALELSQKWSGRPDARAVVADVLKPLDIDTKFDSISMYYLLHCIPATVQEKCRAFALLKHNLTPDGVIHGANILGKGVRKDNWLASFMRRNCLRRGYFHNQEDNAYDFERALRENFKVVETRVVGTIFIFRAEKPKFDD